MKITNVEQIEVGIPWKRPLIRTHDAFPWTHQNANIIKMHTDEGITGISEAHGELSPSFIKSRVIGTDPFEIEKLIGTSILEGPTPSAIATLETACWDIIGKSLNVPVYRLLGGRFWDRVPITITTSTEATEIVVKEAENAVKQGINTIKIKVGENLKTDLDLVKGVREAVGNDVNLRVDPNQSWSVPTAINNINRMAKYYPQYIEQPIAAYDLDGFKRVRDRVPVPLAVCDASPRHTEVMRLIKREAIDFVSSDPNRTGGLWGWKKMDAICTAAGIPLDCHINGLGVSTAIWLAATVTSPSCKYAHDINCTNTGVSKELSDDIITKPFKHENGFLQVPEGPGLGVELDEDKVQKYSNIAKEIRSNGGKGFHGQIPVSTTPNLTLVGSRFSPIY